MTNMTDDIIESINARYRRLAEVRPGNARAVFDALAAAGITEVVVTFDGEGDSGSIEERTARTGAADVPLPAVDVDYTAVDWEGTATTSPITLDDALDNMVYAVLEEKYSGWENNDGAYGEVTFDVDALKMRLDFNERFTSSELYQHEFGADDADGADVPVGDRGFV